MWPGSMPVGIVEVEHGVAAGAEAHALVIGGEEAAAPQSGRKAAGRDCRACACESITTKAGRLRLTLPKP